MTQRLPALAGTDHLRRRRFPSHRSAVLGRRGIVATSQPLAAQAGIAILEAGGNAFDAAVATSAALCVVEPTGTSMGGDAFALLYVAASGAVEALNGSGRSAGGLAYDDLVRQHPTMPVRGALTVTVPGCVGAWADLLERHGRLGLAAALRPAIAIAEGGFPVSELIAAGWGTSERLLAADRSASRHFLPSGRAPAAGELVRLPALARSLRQVADEGAQAVYAGPIGTAIVEAVRAGGGALSHADLAGHRSEWVTPLRVRYGPWYIWQCPPNGQGMAALAALGVARYFDLGSPAWDSADRVHVLIEAMRLGFQVADRWVADPGVAPPIGRVLGDAWLAEAAARIDLRASQPAVPLPSGSDTVYLSVVDEDGNACSLIASNYMGFGSGLVAGDTGISLQNRGAGFTLEPSHPNVYAPGKRPFHTIMPGLATHIDGSLAASFGVMGGHMQPQGHAQLVSYLLDQGFDPQAALDAPRFQLLPSGAVALEPAFGLATRLELAARGHRIVAPAQNPPAGTFGGGQAIIVAPNGIRSGGSDPRKDGLAIAQY